jgi:signal transduction histidine kinase
MKNFMLSSFALMALVIILTALIFFIVLKRSPYNAAYKRWMLIYFSGLLLWHGMGFISGGLHSEWREMTYRYTNTLFNAGLSISCVALIQVAYLFPLPGFEKERKWALWVSVGISGLYLLTITWYHFIRDQAGANSTTYGPFVNSLAGILTLLLSTWIAITFFRKGFYFRRQKSLYAFPAFLMGFSMVFFVLIALLFIYPGANHPVVLPLYIYGMWLILQLQCILFIVYSTFPIPFKTKLLGFTLATMMAILSVTIMAIVPFTTNSSAPDNLAQRIIDQPSLVKLTVVLIVSVFFIVWMFPVILKVNLIQPLNNLVDGMKKADEGNLNVSVPEGLLDEIGIATRNFNKMVASLKLSKEELEKYTGTLEQQVEIRTAELRNSLQELKSAQAQLIQSEKMASLGELTAGIAHEIQNPLNFVNNFSEINTELIEELKTEQSKSTGARNEKLETDLLNDISQNLEKINHHGKRADAIVKGMLQHSRASTGLKEPTDINALCDEYLRLSYHGLRAKDKSFRARYEMDFDSGLGKISVVPQEIGRVILNLINNAFYAVSERKNLNENGYEPTVVVSTKKVHDKIEIRVADNGKGIPQKILDKIFQPFFTTKPTGQGTGLGLSLSYDIVTKGHGGEIKVITRQKDEPGEGEAGSEFIITLPVS